MTVSVFLLCVTHRTAGAVMLFYAKAGAVYRYVPGLLMKAQLNRYNEILAKWEF